MLRLLLLALLVAACGERAADPPAELPRITTPRWAFEPWISKDISTTADTRDFVAGFEARDIPVGVVVIDSPWDVNYTTFQVNPARYPDFPELLRELRGKGIRTVMWVTQMLNEESFDLEPGGDTYDGPAPTFRTARRNDYLVNQGETYLWWKGMGAGLDFFNPEALEWWHQLQDPLLDLGIAGWKLDFGESYISTETIETAAGTVPLQAYSEAYYRDFWEHGVRRLGKDEFVTMVRGWDESYHLPGRFFARPEHSPTIWAGDNRRDWFGLEDALDHMFRSAEAGYVVVGSDIGGYLDLDDKDLRTPVPFDVEVFQRWAAVGAMTPFMQLHGRANIAPWTVPERVEETVEHYRYWSWLHQALIPFFYSLAEEAYEGRAAPIMRPVGGEAVWPGDWRFLVGEAFLVAPILDATGVRDVALPAGARWFDWFAPEADPLEGGRVLMDYASATGRVPLFVREGAIIPMEVASAVTGLGDASTGEDLTVLVYPGEAPSSFTLHEPDGQIRLAAALTEGGAEVTLGRVPRSVRLRIRAEAAPDRVVVREDTLPTLPSRQELDASRTGWWYEGSTRSLWVKLEARAAETLVSVRDR